MRWSHAHTHAHKKGSLITPSIHQPGELKDALVSWQWEVDNPTTEGAIQFVRDYIATAAAQTNK